MKKILYGITLIIGIGISLALLFFPVLEFDREAIYDNYKDDIEAMIAFDSTVGESYEEKKEKAINEIIYNTCIALQMYTKNNDVVYDEDGNLIESGSDTDAMMMDIYRLKEKGIGYTSLAKSIKNQCEFDMNLYRVLKDTGKVDFKIYFANWSNPFLMIGFVILIALEFACAILLIIRSVKGVLEKKRNKVFAISVFGIITTLLIMFLGDLFKSNINLTSVDTINEFVKLFATIIKGTKVCMYSGIGFLVTTIISLFAKFLKY